MQDAMKRELMAPDINKGSPNIQYCHCAGLCLMLGESVRGVLSLVGGREQCDPSASELEFRGAGFSLRAK